MNLKSTLYNDLILLICKYCRVTKIKVAYLFFVNLVKFNYQRRGDSEEETNLIKHKIDVLNEIQVSVDIFKSLLTSTEACLKFRRSNKANEYFRLNSTDFEKNRYHIIKLLSVIRFRYKFAYYYSFCLSSIKRDIAGPT